MRRSQVMTVVVLLVLSVLPALLVSCSKSPSVTEKATPAPESTGRKLATPNPAIVDDELAVVETEYGKFRIRFYPDVAPIHVANFKKLVNEKFYDGLGFHRVIPNDLVQGGDPQTRKGDRELWGMGMPDQPTVPAEFSTRRFIKGTVGMARRGGDVNSATSQFFICLTEHPEWDGQYTVFGEVAQGLETVRLMSNASADRGSQKVDKKIVINRIYLEKAKAK